MSYSLSMSSNSCWSRFDNTTLSDGTINVQWPSYRHMGVFKEPISILLNDCAQHRNINCCLQADLCMSGAKRPRAASNSSDGNSGWSFIGSISSLITSFNPCSGWAAALEGLGWIGTWYSSVLQRLQTRWAGPTGRLWDWQNLRF